MKNVVVSSLVITTSRGANRQRVEDSGTFSGYPWEVGGGSLICL